MELNISIKQVDYLNILLLVLSLFFAVLFPFELFLIAYAILGPLHYLTEINWLHKKNYFTKTKGIVWVFTVLALFFSLPFLLKLPVLETLQSEKPVAFLAKHTNNLVYFALLLSIALIVFKTKIHQIIFILIGLMLAVFSKGKISNNLLVGGFLTTLIHVYLFTVLFMIYGALKSKSKVGILASSLILIVPILLFSTKISPSNYAIAEWWKSAFIENNFHFLHVTLAKLFGTSDGKTFYFYDSPFLKIQTFIAFAYTYHYLNWFSKTSVIGWHKTLSKKSTFVIALIWIISVTLYLMNYRTGFLVLIFLSTLHVFVEFPLNVLSIKGIGEELKKYW